MSEDTTTITRDRAITLINDSIENFATYFDSYCCDNRDSISDEERELYQEMSEVTYILRNDNNYANDLKIMPLEHLTQFLYMCKEMVENNDLFTKYSYPKGNILIVENEKSNPELIEKALESLENYGDLKIKNSIKEYHNGERKIVFRNMPKNQYGITECTNETYVNYLSEELNHDSPENQVRVAVTLAHEFRRNATSDSVDGETKNIVLDDTKIIESFAATYGEEIYKKFPEYGILHYIKKIFGETELQNFVDYAFDSTGSYWKVNSSGDFIDDGNTSKVFDKDGKELYSGSTGRQGSLEAWLGINNAFVSLMQPAGYEYDGEKWSKNPGNIDHSVIEKAHNNGQLTDDQYNLIQLAAGKCSSNKEDGSEKVNLFKQFLIDYQEMNEIKTQVQIDMANRAWKWINNKIKNIKEKKFGNTKNQNNNPQITNSFKNLMESVKTDDLTSPCCDIYSTRVLELINKKPSDWPSPSGYKVCNTPDYTGDNYKDFYSTKWKSTPSEGWNVMIMWANSGEKFENSPHMAVLQKTNDTVNLTHFTGNEQIIREKYSFKNIETSFKYSNFRYMPLGE
ncbi:hypothetical protein [uncultured Treponema sp.]|uniref:hypothetical protein n=1 Tax=uncultured Treponema sp. TaxID=162155 RepID=UPI0025881003|nr:hypothetical protein [uncultured Treponema sp.]